MTIALWAFVWSVKNEQFEDLEKEAHSILFEEKDLTKKIRKHRFEVLDKS